MRPLVSDCKDDHSTDSEEEGNVRHDRFRSERFQEESLKSNEYRKRQREESYSSTDRHDSRRHSRRSPSPRCSKSSNHELRRSNHDRREERHHSKSNKNTKHERNHYKIMEQKSDTNNKSCKRTLSSILKNFDKNLEMKKKTLETEHNIGPAMPPHFQEKLNNDEPLLSNGPLNKVAVIGPALPPSATLKSRSSLEEVKIEQPKAEGHEKIIQFEGPALPPHLTKNLSTCDLKTNKILSSTEVENSKLILPGSNHETNKAMCGPALPPANDKGSYGPALPPNFKKDHVQGPTLPEGITPDQLEALAQEESDDEDMVGPLPEGKMNMTQFQLDLRASHIKRKLDEEKCGTSTDIKKREEWMLELPPEKASNIGLGPRSFRMREAPDMSDRSSWTDTPADKLRKIEKALAGEPEPINTEEMRRTAFIKERESAMDKMAQLTRDQDRPQSLLELHQKKIKKKKKAGEPEPINTEEMRRTAFIKERESAMDKMAQLTRDQDRPQSLLELHQKKIKKKKKKEEKEGKKKERRPFDRNIDLQVNRFDDAQKKAIFKKAQLLDTRFSTGESKYL